MKHQDKFNTPKNDENISLRIFASVRKKTKLMKTIFSYKWLLLVISGIILISCEKVIDLNLNTAGSRIVIEGNITSEPGPYMVSLSTSGDYYTAEGIGPVSGATVVITDNLGASDTLTENRSGKYFTNTLTSESNRTYTVNVSHNNNVYSGTETLPEKVLIDSLSFDEAESVGSEPGGGDNPRYNIYCSFSDPVASENYYRFDVLVNGIPVGGDRNFYSLSGDHLFNGQVVQYTIRNIEAMPKDTVIIGLYTIGFNTYEYFRTLNDALSGSEMGSTPYNPITNLSNNALGYFGAYTLDEDSVVLE